MPVIVLKNRQGDSVEIDEAAAMQLFGRFASMASLARAGGGAADAGGRAATGPAAAAAAARRAGGGSSSSDSEEEESRLGVVGATGGPGAAAGAGGGGGGGGGGGAGGLRLDALAYSGATLRALRAYTELPQRTAVIPTPLVSELSQCVTPAEMAFVADAERGDCLIELLDVASLLVCEPLTALCAAYMSERINDIARRAPSIMDGAAEIRRFLRMENEWTPEEMACLQQEMDYAKMVDPNVY